MLIICTKSLRKEVLDTGREWFKAPIYLQLEAC